MLRTTVISLVMDGTVSLAELVKEGCIPVSEALALVTATSPIKSDHPEIREEIEEAGK